jgi:hypothetical protein
METPKKRKNQKTLTKKHWKNKNQWKNQKQKDKEKTIFQKSWGWGRVSQESQNMFFCVSKVFVFYKVCLVFSMGSSPKRFQICSFGFSHVYFWFLHGALPKESQNMFFWVFSSLRAFTKDRWLPWQWMSWSGRQNLAFAFGTFSVTCVLLWLHFYIHIT